MKPGLIGTSVVVAILVVGSACASGRSADADERENCTLRATDSVFVATGPVYRDCAVDREARLVTREVRTDFTDTGSAACHSVQLEFVVGTDGAPEIETLRTVRATSGEYARAVIETLPKWRYEPARLDGIPVRQIVTAERVVTLRGRFVVRRGSAPPPPQPSRPRC